MLEKDSTATHFIANKKEDDKGYAIILYRITRHETYGQTECNCTPELKARNSKCFFCISKELGDIPEYLGPLGWRPCSFQIRENIMKKLLPVEKLEEITGDNLEKEIWQEHNIYAG